MKKVVATMVKDASFPDSIIIAKIITAACVILPKTNQNARIWVVPVIGLGGDVKEPVLHSQTKNNVKPRGATLSVENVKVLNRVRV
jgi:hypothetical protein